MGWFGETVTMKEMETACPVCGIDLWAPHYPVAATETWTRCSSCVRPLVRLHIDPTPTIRVSAP